MDRHFRRSCVVVRLLCAAAMITALPTVAGCRPNPDERETDVRQVIETYFRTWSDQDMEGYGATFMGGACVQFIDSEGEVQTQGLTPFLEGQAEYHRTAQHPSTEVPETMDIRFEADLARVVVYWKLTAGPRTEYGYDHFTLMRHDGAWRIVNLVFYLTE